MTNPTIAARRREEMAALLKANGGAITPKQVVTFAENPKTALHSLFTWDNTDAAQRWREFQAQGYLRAVVTMVPRESGEPVRVRAFVSLSTDRGESCVYRPIESVLEDDTHRQTLLQDALNELAALRTKYSHLEELAGVWEAIPVPLAA